MDWNETGPDNLPTDGVTVIGRWKGQAWFALDEFSAGGPPDYADGFFGAVRYSHASGSWFRGVYPLPDPPTHWAYIYAPAGLS